MIQFPQKRFIYHFKLLHLHAENEKNSKNGIHRD